MTRTWKILDYGAVPENAPRIIFACPGCEREALLPALGLALAQIGEAVVFDNTPHALPKQMQCRHCRRRFELE